MQPLVTVQSDYVYVTDVFTFVPSSLGGVPVTKPCSYKGKQLMS